MDGKELGQIRRAKFGFGGYQDAMIGLTLEFGGQAWGTSHFDGAWSIKRSEYCQWTEEDRIRQLGESVMRLKDILAKAKCNSVDGLVGKPVEVIFEGNMLKSFRLLEEVL